MAITIQFFNVFLKNNKGYTNLSITDFLDGIISLEENDRYVENDYGNYSLIEMLPPNLNPNDNSIDRLVGFANYRDKKPFAGKKGTDTRNEIKEDILELTTCLFIPGYHLLVTEYNHFGARPKHIERYLNTFLPEENGWHVEMTPIETEKSFSEIKKSHEIRNIEIKLDLITGLTNIFKNAEKTNNKSITSSINSVAKSFENIGANIATINIGQGRSRSKKMDYKKLLELLQAIDMENDNVASVKVKYRNIGSDEIETTDLKNEGQLKRVIMEESNATAFEAIAIEISNYYYGESNRIANQAWRNITQTFSPAELPLVHQYSGEKTE